ncbi:MAG: acyl carrier protein [Chloroflexi bacterium]|nr:acyl carrier protein [Chloroflexota bacterium]
MDEVRRAVREYILEAFLPGERPDELTDTTPLVTGGILDSLASLRLVAFLEETYGIEVQAHEANVDNLDSVADIANLVCSKQTER